MTSPPILLQQNLHTSVPGSAPLHDEIHGLGRRDPIAGHQQGQPAHQSPIAAESRANPSSNSADIVNTDHRAGPTPGQSSSIAPSPSFPSGQAFLPPTSGEAWSSEHHQRLDTADPRSQAYATPALLPPASHGAYYSAPWAFEYPYPPPHHTYYSAYYNTAAAGSPFLPYPAAHLSHYGGFPTAPHTSIPELVTPAHCPASPNIASTFSSSGNLRQGVLPFARHSVSDSEAPPQVTRPAAHGHPPPVSSLRLPLDSTHRHRHSLSSAPSQAYIPPVAPSLTLPVENSQSTAYYERPTCTWIQFLSQWRIHVTTAEQDLAAKAKLGHVSDYTPVRMATEYPSLADCDSLINGLKNAGSRVTAERLKMLIRGLNTNHGVLNVVGQTRLTGNKAELQKRVSEALQILKARQSDEYYAIAKLIGEAQGITYSSPTTGHSSIPVPAPTTASASAYSTSASHPLPTFPQNSTAGYASRPSEFGLDRNTNTNGYGTSSASQVSTSARPCQPSNHQAARNTSYSQASRYGAGTTAAYGRPLPPAMTQQQRYGSINGLPSAYSPSVNHLNNSIPTSWPALAPPKMSLGNQPAVPINFRPSPFYKLVAGVTQVVTLQKALPGDRLTATAYIVLSEDQRQKLLTSRNESAATQFQLRLYCTSVDFYSSGQTFGSYQNNRPPALMEFPAVCEAKLNDQPVTGNLKGIKKKPGTAPPASLSETKVKVASQAQSSDNWALNLSPGATNKVDLNYINTEKLHYMIVYLVEASSIDHLVEKIKQEKSRTREDTIKKIKRQNEDQDLVATSQSVSMKDPLSFMDMATPIRSVHCPHLQCFDAAIFLSMMEQTPTWACPVCNRTMQPDDLVHDGFSQDILKAVPKDNYDHVIVEVDGTWRTEDNKYGTATAITAAKHESAIAQASGLSSAGLNPPESAANGFFSKEFSEAGIPLDLKPDMSRTASGNGLNRTQAVAAVIDLDNEDSDDDAPRIPGAAAYRQPMTSSMTAGGYRASQQGRHAPSTVTGGAVIDLTLDSDDDGMSQSGRNEIELGPPGAATTLPSSDSTGADNKRRAPSQWDDEAAANPSAQRPRYE